MKIAIFIFSVLLLSACKPGASTVNGIETNQFETCKRGVLYYRGIYHSTPAYNIDGSLIACEAAK